MKTLKYTLSIITLSLAIVSCKNETTPEVKTVETQVEEVTQKFNPDAEYITASFEIEGMACPMGCAKPIEKNLAKMDGVKKAEVNFETKTATVYFDETLASQDAFIAAVKNTGKTYSVSSWNGAPIVEAE